MIDSLPPEIGLPLAAVLWAVYAIQLRREHVARRRRNRSQ